VVEPSSLTRSRDVRWLYVVDSVLVRAYCSLIWHHRGHVEYFTGYAECQRCFKVWSHEGLRGWDDD
jgi:hypothetical protein